MWAGAAVTHLKRLERVQHRFVLWLARYSDRPSDEREYRALLAHFTMLSVKARFAQHDLMFLHKVYRASIDSAELLGMFGLSVPGRTTRSLALWHIPRGRVNTVQRSVFTRSPSLCNMFLNHDLTVDFFSSTTCSFKSSVISFARTLESY